MKKSYRDKIIFGLMIISLVFTPALSLLSVTKKAEAASDSSSSNYTFNLSNIMNSGLLNAVIGCTGITDKLGKLVNSIFSPQDNVDPDTTDGSATSDTIPVEEASAAAVRKAAEETAKTTKGQKTTSECFNGIAFYLAKKQLADITQKTVNWINSGYNGSAFFVKNQDSFFQNVSNSTLSQLLAPFAQDSEGNYPFGKDLARSVIVGARNNAQDMLKTTIPAQDATDFSRSFNNGGWSQWLNVTQNPGNNPLGFSAGASDLISNGVNSAISKVDKELTQNGGFLSDKRCVKYEEPPAPATDEDGFLVSPPDQAQTPSKCAKWETVTPGSIIASKAANAVGSPERQLEMANDINSSLSQVFSALIDSLANWGLSSLTGSSYKDETNPYDFGSEGLNAISNDLGKSTTGSYYDVNGDNVSPLISVSEGSGWSNSDGQKLDLVKDLADSCVYNDNTKAYELHAGPIIPTQLSYIEAIKGNPKVADPTSFSYEPAKPLTPNGSFTYTVGGGNVVIGNGGSITVDGRNSGQFKLKLPGIDEGSEGQLKYIMPALGSLDYCIPGPNPNWATSTKMSLNAMTSYLQDIYINSSGKTVYPKYTNYINKFNDPLKPWLQLNRPMITANVSTDFVRNGMEDWEAENSSWMSLDSVGLTGIVDTVVCWFRNCKSNATRQAEAMAAAAKQLENARGTLDATVKNQIDSMNEQFKVYNSFYEQTYGYNSPMLKQDYYGYDTYYNQGPNSQYLPMGIAGLEMTRNMGVYATNVDDSILEYNNLVTKSISNVYQLRQIKSKIEALMDEVLKNPENIPIIQGADSRCFSQKGRNGKCYPVDTTTYSKDPNAYSKDAIPMAPSKVGGEAR